MGSATQRLRIVLAGFAVLGLGVLPARAQFRGAAPVRSGGPQTPGASRSFPADSMFTGFVY